MSDGQHYPCSVEVAADIRIEAVCAYLTVNDVETTVDLPCSDCLSATSKANSVIVQLTVVIATLEASLAVRELAVSSGIVHLVDGSFVLSLRPMPCNRWLVLISAGSASHTSEVLPSCQCWLAYCIFTRPE